MSGNTEKTMLPDEELDWIQLRRDFDMAHPETTKEKMVRKIKENPVVPIGCLATASALVYGLYSFRRGDRKMSQMMMRTRIAAQGLTVVALIAGVVMTYGRKKE